MGVHSQIPRPNTNQSRMGEKTRSNNYGAIEILLALEAEMRQCTTPEQLRYLIVNESAKLISARQIVLMEGYKKPKITTITSLATLDRTSPTLQWLEAELDNVLPLADLSAQTYGEKDGEETVCKTGILEPGAHSSINWPFRNTLQINLPSTPAGPKRQIAFLAEKPFFKNDQAMASRLTDTFAHALNALTRSPFSFAKLLSKKLFMGGTILAVLAMFVPVTMTVLAPVEIAARDPEIVAAPLNGVIESINVDPNEHVEIGDLLYSYNATDLSNGLDIATQAVIVAESRYWRASQDALSSGVGRREMAELKSELELANAKLAYADQLLQQAGVKATKNGIVLFSDKDDWIGKPVVTGEKVMKIATPEKIEFAINLPASDSIILRDGNAVRIFLDSDPLNPVDGRISRRSYHATIDEANNLAYRLIAQLDSENGELDAASQRIGLRGTAQIFGSKVPLGLFLFRKPLSVLRQYFGF